MAQSDVREAMIASADYLTETPSSDLTSLQLAGVVLCAVHARYQYRWLLGLSVSQTNERYERTALGAHVIMDRPVSI